MNFVEAVLMALSSLRANRLRSLLTLIGIVIGVMTVVTVLSFISGLNEYVTEKIFNLGPDVFLITRTPFVTVSLEDWVESEKRPGIYLDDAEAIRESCPECRAVGASEQTQTRVKYGRDFINQTEIRGYTHEMTSILGTPIATGRELTTYDVEHARNVAVIGADVAELLFSSLDPLGREIWVEDRAFEVVGVGEKQGAVIGQSRDNWVVIPISVYQRMWGGRQNVRIYVKAGGEDHVATAEDQARLVMRTRRRLKYTDKDNFSINTNANFLELWAQVSRAFFAVTVAIASISLIVGGIVVMNIMLVSVTERTHEIGIRKAAGARSRDILVQFLIESAVLSLAGGMIGITLGSAIPLAVSWFTPMPASVKWWSIAAAIIASTSVGLFFGIYPARRAAQMNPIAALRHE
jgi:putative ABC transport system permease protein